MLKSELLVCESRDLVLISNADIRINYYFFLYSVVFPYSNNFIVGIGIYPQIKKCPHWISGLSII